MRRPIAMLLLTGGVLLAAAGFVTAGAIVWVIGAVWELSAYS